MPGIMHETLMIGTPGWRGLTKYTPDRVRNRWWGILLDGQKLPISPSGGSQTALGQHLELTR